MDLDKNVLEAELGRFGIAAAPGDKSKLLKAFSNIRLIVEDGHAFLDGYVPLPAILGFCEVTIIQESLRLHNGNITRAAGFLSLKRTTLVEKMKKFGIHAQLFRSAKIAPLQDPKIDQVV